MAKKEEYQSLGAKFNFSSNRLDIKDKYGNHVYLNVTATIELKNFLIEKMGGKE